MTLLYLLFRSIFVYDQLVLNFEEEMTVGCYNMKKKTTFETLNGII